MFINLYLIPYKLYSLLMPGFPDENLRGVFIGVALSNRDVPLYCNRVFQ